MNDKRAAFLSALIGQPWAHDRSCWHVAALVQATLFGRQLPHVDVPPDPSWRWMIDTIERHPEHANWAEVVAPLVGLVTAGDGALVALARVDRAAHIGVWLAAERLVIHCDQDFGIVAQDIATLRASGWGRIRFYEPVTD